MRKWFGLALCEFLLLALSAGPALGQDTGSITGSVRDTSGAIVPGATVNVTNSERGINLKTVTNSDGDYLVAGLGAGSYDLSITAQGFKRFDVTGIVLRVAQKARIDATLELGTVSSSVTVKGEQVAQVETQSAEMSGIVTQQQISQLVLNGRNFTQLIVLTPGVSNQTGQDEGVVGVNGNVNYSVNGGRTSYNNWEIDGGDNMDNGSNQTLNVYPNVDAIAEVKVLTSNYGAQYGRNASGTIETVTKSGGKDFHGDAFEFVRNDVFNARNFFDVDRPAYKKNDFGYTIGGPLVIPHLYNTGRDKTFFFFSEEWRREVLPNTFNVEVPSVAERGGDFNDVCPGADCPRDPTTGLAFPSNQVSVDANAQAIMTLIPAPNAGSGAASFYMAAPSQPTDWREEMFRIDHNITDKTRFYYRFIHDSWSTVTPTPTWDTGSFPTVKGGFDGPGISMVANLTATASPTLLNEFVFSYTADHIFIYPIGPYQRPSSMTMSGIFDNGFGGELPVVTITGGAAYGGGFSAGTGYDPWWRNSNPTYTFRDQLTKIKGRHNIYIGFYAVAAQKNEMAWGPYPHIQGILDFSNTSSVTTGNAFTDFLVGRVANFTQSQQGYKFYQRYKIMEPYIQDDWRVTNHLTLNAGFRLSLFGTYREKYRHAYNFDPTAYSLSQAAQIDTTGAVTGQEGALIPNSGNDFDGLVDCGVSGVPRGCMNGHVFNPAPRIGFSYDPFGTGKTAIRGGYGVFFDHSNGNEANTNSLESQPPLVLTPTQYNILGYTDIGGSGSSPLLFPLTATAIQTKANWPYMQQWSLSVQREWFRNTVFNVAYVGSKGTNLYLQTDMNQLHPVPLSENPYGAGQVMTPQDCQNGTVNGQPVSAAAAANFAVACGSDPNPLRPFRGYGYLRSVLDKGNSNYNSLQVSARRMIGKLQYSVAYTYSHTLDDNSSDLDSYNLRNLYASSNIDQRHVLNISYIYDLPSFKRAGAVSKAIGGWQFSGITSFQTGTPFSIDAGSTGDIIAGAGVANGSSGVTAYPELIGNPHASPPVNQAAGVIGPLLYNPGAFAAPQGLTFGDAGRDILFVPARTNFDMGLFKAIPIKESKRFEFRVESFNVFNHTQWNGVNNYASCYGGADHSVGDASCIAGNTFLHPSGAHNPRILQFGLKLIF